MKKTFLFFLIIITSITSCSRNEEPIGPIVQNPKITKWIFKNYFSGNPNLENAILTDSVVYTLSNNKIISYTGQLINGGIIKSKSGTFIYNKDNKISEIISYQDNQLFSKDTYKYYDSGKIDEFTTQLFAPTPENLLQVEFKTKYTHTKDTIFSRMDITNYTQSGEIGGVQTNYYKIVLDGNDNQLFYSIDNSFTSQSTYNESNNLILKVSDNSAYKFSYSYLYSSTINTKAIILKETFGTHVLNTTHGNLGSNYFPYEFSKNTIESAFQTHPSITFSYEINTKENEKKYATFTSVKEIMNGGLTELFTSEFIIE